jgi:precorrin-2 methylase
MEAVEQDYELSEADLKIVASEVKELTEGDEAFASYQEKLAVVFAHKSKDHLKAEKEKFDSAVAEAVEKRVSEIKEAKASSESPETEADKKENLEEALEAAEQVTPEISNTNEASSGETETLRTKFQSAFSKENIKVTY